MTVKGLQFLNPTKKEFSAVAKTSYFNFAVSESREKWREIMLTECCCAAQVLIDHIHLHTQIP